MKPRKKNQFFTLLFSFVPGAAEMYMGFMKSGLSILGLFMIPWMLTAVIYGANFIALLSCVVYIAGFFHARNLATAPDEQFEELEDKYIWEEFGDIRAINIPAKVSKMWTAVALIFVGICGIWEFLKDWVLSMASGLAEQDLRMVRNIVNSVPRVVFSVIVIVAGIMLVRGRKKELTTGENEQLLIEDKSLATEDIPPITEEK